MTWRVSETNCYAACLICTLLLSSTWWTNIINVDAWSLLHVENHLQDCSFRSVPFFFSPFVPHLPPAIVTNIENGDDSEHDHFLLLSGAPIIPSNPARLPFSCSVTSWAPRRLQSVPPAKWLVPITNDAHPLRNRNQTSDINEHNWRTPELWWWWWCCCCWGEGCGVGGGGNAPQGAQRGNLTSVITTRYSLSDSVTNFSSRCIPFGETDCGCVFFFLFFVSSPFFPSLHSFCSAFLLLNNRCSSVEKQQWFIQKKQSCEAREKKWWRTSILLCFDSRRDLFVHNKMEMLD